MLHLLGEGLRRDPRSCPPSHLLFNIAIVCLVLYLLICNHVGAQSPRAAVPDVELLSVHTQHRKVSDFRQTLVNNNLLVNFQEVTRYLDTNTVVNAAE